MRALPFEGANIVFRLADAGPERGVPAKVGDHAGPDGVLSPTDPSAAMPYALTRWTPDSAERAMLAVGGDIELVVFGGGFPPVSLGVTQGELDGMFVWASLPPATAQLLVDLIENNRNARLDAAVAAGVSLKREQLLELEGLEQLRDTLSAALRKIDENTPPAPPPPPPRRR